MVPTLTLPLPLSSRLPGANPPPLYLGAGIWMKGHMDIQRQLERATWVGWPSHEQNGANKSFRARDQGPGLSSWALAQVGSHMCLLSAPRAVWGEVVLHILKASVYWPWNRTEKLFYLSSFF
jgi:hypothetical protein